MSDIRKRRNSLLKSSLSINSIRNTVVNFTKGLVSSRETATEIVKKTNENNKFKRTLIGKDNSFFEKRRENARRRQREDELESSTVSGVTKRQGSVTSRSTKGFLGRILDFFGIILIGWFVNTLPQIIKSIQGLIDRIRKMVSVLTNFVDSIGDFLTGIRTGISNAIQKLPKLDLGQLRRQNEDSLDSANDNLNKVRRDMISTVGVYNDPTNAGLESYDEDQPLIFDEFGGDEKKDEKKDENKTEDPTKDKVEGVGDDKNLKSYEKNKRGPTDSKKQEDNDPNNQEFIKTINDQKEIKDIKSAESQSKGETIENRDEANKFDKDEKDKAQTDESSLKNYFATLIGGQGQQQADKLSNETTDKKDNSSQFSGALSKIKTIVSENSEIFSGKQKEIKVVSNQRPNRDNLNTGSKKNRSQVVIIEKGIPMNQSSAPSGGGGGGSSLNSLDGLKDSEDMKKGIKKLQSIILST